MPVPLLTDSDPGRPLIYRESGVVSVGEFMGAVRHLAMTLPPSGALVNLCEHRDAFLIGWCAALLRGRTNLLPASRAPQVVEEVLAQYPGSFRCDDESVARAMAQSGPLADPRGLSPAIPERMQAAIAFTSGSTGKPRPHVKRWGNFLASSTLNATRIRDCLAPRHGLARPSIVATVPPQHMYGTETSVLLPLLAGMAVHAGRPLFPADVARALDDVPEPRILVTTPVHLRALVGSGERFPAIAVVLSATAPLDAELAISVERELGTMMLEMFGSTETCVIATRRTAQEPAWWLYPGVRLRAGEDSAEVSAAWFDAPTTLQDMIEVLPDHRFIVRGRNTDMIEVAGKRSSAADLTRRLLAVPGVQDAVVFQPDSAGDAAVRRVAAVVVAPGLAAESISEQLSRAVDPAFLPRPLVLVSALPRNDVGKIEREALAKLVAEFRAAGGGSRSR